MCTKLHSYVPPSHNVSLFNCISRGVYHWNKKTTTVVDFR